jgi:hypothetical protein
LLRGLTTILELILLLIASSSNGVFEDWGRPLEINCWRATPSLTAFLAVIVVIVGLSGRISQRRH